MPSWSQRGVRTVMALRRLLCSGRSGGGMFGDVLARPAVVGLTGYGTADGIHEPDAARDLVPGDLAADMILQRGHVRRGTRAKLDERGHPLAEAVRRARRGPASRTHRDGTSAPLRPPRERPSRRRCSRTCCRGRAASPSRRPPPAPGRRAPRNASRSPRRTSPRSVPGPCSSRAGHARRGPAGPPGRVRIRRRASSRTMTSGPAMTVGTAAVRLVRADERDSGEAGLGGADRLGDHDIGQRLGAGVLDGRREQRRAGGDGDQRGDVIGPGQVRPRPAAWPSRRR